MQLKRAKKRHFYRIHPQQNQTMAQIGPEMEGYIATLLASQERYVVLNDDSMQVIALFGSVEQTLGIASAWSVLSEGIGTEGLLFTTRAIRRKTKELLRYKGFRRVEFTVESDYVEGVVWARLLGFRAEGVLNKFGADGKDHILYARWKGM